MSPLSVVCCQSEVSASDRSLVQRSSSECGVSECDHEVMIMIRPWRTKACCVTEKKKEVVMYMCI
jgi:hypothetical protein